jgi:hypothetical protein
MKMVMQILFQIWFPVLKYTQTYVKFKSLVLYVKYEKRNYFVLNIPEGKNYILYFLILNWERKSSNIPFLFEWAILFELTYSGEAASVVPLSEIPADRKKSLEKFKSALLKLKTLCHIPSSWNKSDNSTVHNSDNLLHHHAKIACMYVLHRRS